MGGDGALAPRRVTLAPMSALSIPEARGLPLLGNIPAMLRDAPGCLLGAVREHGPLVRVRFGSGGMLLVTHPEDLEHVLQLHNRRYVRGHTVDMIRPMLGNGLPLSDGEFWLRQRRTMQPLFARPRIATLVPTIVEVSRRYLAELRDGAELSTHYLMMRITRDVIVETMFSSELGHEAAALDSALATIEHHVARYGFLPIRIPAWLPTPDNVRFRRAIATLDRVVYGLISRRRAEPTADQAPARDLLDALMQARDPETGNAMSTVELRDEVMNIFFAGHETTANLLTWTVLELSRHAHVEARLRDEVDAVLRGREPAATDLPALEYVNAVLRETLRLHPAAWIFAREATEDDELRGHRVAQGSAVVLFPYATHRMPELWPEPERFDPERFLRDRSIGLGGTKNWAYLPFGAGPHVCIGNHLAMAEATIVLAALYQRGRLRALHPERARPRASATLHVADGLPARFDAHG
jgi:cytochrome P450